MSRFARSPSARCSDSSGAAIAQAERFCSPLPRPATARLSDISLSPVAPDAHASSGQSGVGLRKRDGGELDVRAGDLCARRRFSPMARYFRYLTDNLRGPVL